jgi:hypothetical protein
MSSVMRRGGLVLLAIVPLLTASLVPSAAAATPHRALVVVDTGSGTVQRVVTFESESITGLRALELAGANPAVYSFAGQGGAVCKLFGVGRDVSPYCLGGADGDNRYWAYFRAAAGSTSFAYSRAGAGATQVRDGDVEGWRWGTGQAPAWSPVPPPPGPPATAPPPPPSGNSPGAAPGPVDGAPAVSTPAGAAAAAGTAPSAEDLLKLAAAMDAAKAASTSTTSTTSPETEVQGRTESGPSTRRIVAPVLPDDGSGGGAAPLVGFGVALAALAGGALFLRHRRRGPIP